MRDDNFWKGTILFSAKVGATFTWTIEGWAESNKCRGPPSFRIVHESQAPRVWPATLKESSPSVLFQLLLGLQVVKLIQ